MKFELARLNGTDYGHLAENQNGLFFFGFQNCTAETLSLLFPKLHFYKAQQVHGTALAKAPFSNPPTADDVWTNEPLSAPTVVTADCMPVLVLHPQFAAAIHAGWRGVLAEIVPKTLAAIFELHSDVSALKICIGPHIQAHSFEVGTEVVQSFQTKLPYFSMDLHSLPHANPGKRYLKLNTLVMRQLANIGVSENQIYQLPYDTLTDRRWASYRRDKQQNLRNFSFAARLK
jgi:YfiH family protein